MLGDQVSARIVQSTWYPTANAAAWKFIDAEVRDNSVIFPSTEDILRSEWYMPLSNKGALLYQETWQRFLEGGQ